PPGLAPVVDEPPRSLEEALEVGSRNRDPVVRERRGPLERELAPTADPDRRVRPLHGRGLEPPLERVVAALEADAPVRPERFHDPELLLQPGPAPLHVDPVEREPAR